MSKAAYKKILDHFIYKEKIKTIGLIFPVIIVFFLLLFTYFDIPVGLGKEVTGTLIRAIYIKPRLETPYMRLTVKLTNDKIIKATGLPIIEIKLNNEVVLLRRERLISHRNVYEFSHYLE